ncbi:hypothetical protein PF004_g25017 [Phytophthora fragariae]|uniref:Uncharacterized protein n=1 Tax=Phytophthora fragariae TaxID=53985 RepID=A0A6G0MSI1_9STRA|nr:hypothetical protein PF004_g25017 [Phytophthora fragariae]
MVTIMMCTICFGFTIHFVAVEYIPSQNFSSTSCVFWKLCLLISDWSVLHVSTLSSVKDA